MGKEIILMTFEAISNCVFAYISRAYNDMVDEFDTYLIYLL